MEQDNEHDNLIDFTAYKLRNMVEHLAAIGRVDLASAMQVALDEYLLGNVDIVWQEGWPYIEDDNDNDNDT
jgi:hypothetical protein